MKFFYISMALTNIFYILIFLTTGRFYIPFGVRVFLVIYLFILVYFIYLEWRYE